MSQFSRARIIYHFFRENESWVQFEVTSSIGDFNVGDTVDRIGDEDPLNLEVSEVQHQIGPSALEPEVLLHEIRIFTKAQSGG